MINVITYLEESTKRTPDKVAIIDEHQTLTYKGWLKNSQRIGTYLVEHHKPTTPVVVFMEKGAEALSCFMGIAYARNFYIFIDPKQHPTRMQQIFAVAKPELMITYGATPDDSVGYQGKIVTYESLMDYEASDQKLKESQKNALDIDALYCNFTSGTTGVPKGVIVSHRSVIDFMNYFPDLFEITSEDRIANQAPFDFDVSVKDIYSSLKVGATLVVVPKKHFSVITNLMDYLDDHEVTTMIWAVSALCMMVQFRGFKYKTPSHINKVLFSGEAMPLPMLKAWQKIYPEARFVNLYGPTEITCNCTYYEVPASFDDDFKMPIGVAFPNEKILILDENDKEVKKVNTPGEICVGGTALALGYYNNPEQTNKAFVQNPLNSYYPEIIYRTGDLGYMGDDGLYYFSGRKDFQIKHMGHRIELEEIETVSYKETRVKRICCIYNDKKHRIVACYVGDIESQELRKYLESELPHYMVPNDIVQLETMPLNNNGKTDRKRLRAEYGE